MTAEDGSAADLEVAKHPDYGSRYDATVTPSDTRTVTADKVCDLIFRSPHVVDGLHEVVEVTEVLQTQLQCQR